MPASLNDMPRTWLSVARATLGLVALAPGLVSAQTFAAHTVYGRYQQAVWQELQGLPQNTVFPMTRTRDGYLWFERHPSRRTPAERPSEI